MLNFLITVLLIGFGSAFVHLVFGRLNWFAWLQLHGNKFVSEAAKCRLCSVFWINLAISIVFVLVFWNPVLLLVPIFSTILSLILLKSCLG